MLHFSGCSDQHQHQHKTGVRHLKKKKERERDVMNQQEKEAGEESHPSLNPVGCIRAKEAGKLEMFYGKSSSYPL